MGVQVRLRRAGGGAPGQALCETQERRDGTGHHLLGEAERRPGGDAANILDVAADRPGLVGEGADEAALVLLGIAAGAQVDSGVDEAVVGLRHAVPHQFAAGEVVEVRAGPAAGRDLTDVVQAHVPGGPVASEGVSQTSRFRVLLEDEDPLARHAGEHARGGQSSDAGADDDDVVCHVSTLLVTRRCQVAA